MSYQASAWAAKVKTGGNATKSVLMAIAHRAGDNGATWVSHATVAEETELARDTVARKIADLVAGGWLAVLQRCHTDGTRASNLTVVLMSQAEKDFAILQGWRQDVGKEVPDTGGGTPILRRGIPPSESGCTPRESRGDPDPDGGTMNNQTNNHSRSTPTPGGGGGGGDAKLQADAELQTAAQLQASADWQAFMAVWQFAESDSLANARRQLEHLPPGDRAAAIGAAKRYLAGCDAGKIRRKHASSWLAGRGWEAVAAARVARDPHAGMVFIQEGTPEFGEWFAYRLKVERQPKPFVCENLLPDGRRSRGFWRPSARPPWPDRMDATGRLDLAV